MTATDEGQGLTKGQAESIASAVYRYWQNRGYFIDIRAERVTDTDSIRRTKKETGWCVRSNLLNGLPVDFQLQRKGLSA